MATDANVLEFTKREHLSDTFIYQLQNGTTLYHQYQRSPQRLYTKWKERRIEAKLPKGDIQNMGSHENALYFEANGKIHKAESDVPGPIEIKSLRSLLENETTHGGALCCRVRDGRKHVYRMNEDPDMDGVYVDVEDEQLRGLELRGIHRGRALYIGYHYRLSAQNLSENVMFIQIPRVGEASVYTRESSSLIFISNGPSLFTLDTNTMKFLPTLSLRHIWIHSIAGIRWNYITVGGFESSEFHLMTAQLPTRFLEESKPIPGRRFMIKRRQSVRSDSSSSAEPTPIDWTILRKPSVNSREMNSEVEASSRKDSNCATSSKPIDVRNLSETASNFEEQNIIPEDRSKDKGMIVERSSIFNCPLPRPIDQSPPDSQVNVLVNDEKVVKGVQREIEEWAKERLEWANEREELMRSIREYEKKLSDALHDLFEKEEDVAKMKDQISEMQHMLIESSISALQSATSRSLKFDDFEKLSKPYVCIQLENGTIMYFDNAKPFELFAMVESVSEFQASTIKLLRETRIDADLKLLEGEFDCSFKGTIGNQAFFSAVRGRIVRFFKASIENGFITFEQISELKTSDLILFDGEPMYFVEESREWAVYKYDENYEDAKGESFNISGIRSISKYERHYHRGILYFFRENSTPKLERLNEKVVLVEGPILDGTLSFYTPPHSDCIYIANSDQNVLLILNTVNFSVSQQNYEPPIESTYHWIVGVHNGILTMAFEGKGVGRCLMTTKLL